MYALYCIWQRSIDDSDFSGTEPETPSNSGLNSPIRPSSAQGDRSSPVNRRSMISDDGSLAPPQAMPSLYPHGHVQHTVPAIFADAGWEKMNTTILSTSNCGNPSLRQFGFGPTTGDGFGLGYIIKDGSVSICASSKHRQTARFVESLEAYFIEIRKLLRQTKKRGPSTDKTTSRAREAEDQQTKKGRIKSRGRNILTDVRERVATPTSPSAVDESDEEGLGGCTYQLPLPSSPVVSLRDLTDRFSCLFACPSMPPMRNC
jgi:carnitine O-acetyltransferase